MNFSQKLYKSTYQSKIFKTFLRLKFFSPKSEAENVLSNVLNFSAI